MRVLAAVRLRALLGLREVTLPVPQTLATVQTLLRQRAAHPTRGASSPRSPRVEIENGRESHADARGRRRGRHRGLPKIDVKPTLSWLEGRRASLPLAFTCASSSAGQGWMALTHLNLHVTVIITPEEPVD